MLTTLPLLAFAALVSASAASKNHGSACADLTVINEGKPAGEIKNVSGIQIYHSYPPTSATGYGRKATYDTAILHISDIFGLPLLENKLLADSLALASHLVLLPDLFAGDAISATDPEATLNLTAWSARHPPAAIDAVIEKTIAYARSTYGVKKIGAVGYCFGGKYVPRWMAGKGIDVGFIAHPSNLQPSEIQGIAGPISIAAGELDNAFNSTLRRNAEDILTKKNATYQTTLYSGAPHGFGVRVDWKNPRQRYAKESSYFQAVRWFDAWL